MVDRPAISRLLAGSEAGLIGNAETTRRATASPACESGLPSHAAGWRRSRHGALSGFHQHRQRIRTPRRSRPSGRASLQRGETVYVAGLRRVRHAQHRRLALIEVTQAGGPRHRSSTTRKSASPARSTRPNIRGGRSMRWWRTAACDRARCRRYRWLIVTSVGLSGPARRHAGAHGARGSCRGSLRLLLNHAGRRPSIGRRMDQMTADAAAARQAVRPRRTRAADLHAASRQPRRVWLCRLAVPGQFRAGGYGTGNGRPGRRRQPFRVLRRGVTASSYLGHNDSLFDSIGGMYAVTQLDPGGLDGNCPARAASWGQRHGARWRTRDQSVLPSTAANF